MDTVKLLLIVILTSSLLVPVTSSSVHYLERWGIYELDLESQKITPLFTNPEEIITVRLDSTGERLAVCMKTGGTDYEHSEIYTMNTRGESITRLTENEQWDLYPSWSPDGESIAFLSFRDETLDLWMMDDNGENQRQFYDSSGHDADIHWVGELIAFTRDSQIWIINSDGSNPRQVTNPPNAGEWGDAVLPFGDYDPRISPDGTRIVFERLVDDSTQHGNYDLFMTNLDGSEETRLTDNGWTQGLVSWSKDGQKLVDVVSATEAVGRYDLYLMNPDGSEVMDLTSDLFPSGFLANSPIFSHDNSKIYFIGQWWDWETLDTSITCDVEPSMVTIGGKIEIVGSVGPFVETIAIDVKVIQPDGIETIREVTTDNGNYSISFEPVQAGLWSVIASWEGDSGHSEVSSMLIEFTVIDESVHEQETEGIPGFNWETILAGYILYYLIWKHF